MPKKQYNTKKDALKGIPSTQYPRKLKNGKWIRMKKPSGTKKKTATKLTPKKIYKTETQAEATLPKGWLVKKTKGGYIQMKEYAYMKEAEKRKAKKPLKIQEIDIEHAIMRHENQSERIDGDKIAKELYGKKVSPSAKGKIAKVFAMMKRRNWVKKKAKLEFD